MESVKVQNWAVEPQERKKKEAIPEAILEIYEYCIRVPLSILALV
jgi:hypothetical protein